MYKQQLSKLEEMTRERF